VNLTAGLYVELLQSDALSNTLLKAGDGKVISTTKIEGGLKEGKEEIGSKMEGEKNYTNSAQVRDRARRSLLRDTSPLMPKEGEKERPLSFP